MPNNEEDTLAASTEQVTPASDSQSDAQVTNPAEDANTPPEAVEEIVLGKPKSYWEKIETENERLRSGQSTLQRKLNRYERQQQDSEGVNEYASEDDFMRDVLIKQAELEINAELPKVFEEYPNIPENIKKAIQNNPRGFAKQGTVYVSDAMDDIRDYLDSISQSLGEAPGSTPTAQPKRFPVAPTNPNGNSTANPKVEQIVNVLKGPGGKNEAFRLFTEKKITEAELDEAIELAQSRK